MTPPTPLIVATIALGVVVLSSGIWIPLLIWLRQRRVQRGFAALAYELGGPPHGNTIDVAAHGARFAVHLHPAGRASPWMLEVALPEATTRNARSSVLLRPESGIDRLGKRLGINREVQIGNEAFDRAVYIESDAPEAEVHALLDAADRQRAVLDLFALGFRRIVSHRPGALLAASRERPRPEDFTRARFEQVAASLLSLAAGVARNEHPTRQVDAPAVPVALVRVLALLVLGVGAIFGGWIAFSYLRQAYLPIDTTIYYVGGGLGLAVALAAMPMVALSVRGKSDSFRTFVVLAIVLFIAMPGWTSSAVVFSNGAFDASRPKLHRTRVATRWSTTGKNAGQYVRLSPLRPGDDPLTLRVEPEVYDRFKEGDDVEVTEGAGAFGWR